MNSTVNKTKEFSDALPARSSLSEALMIRRLRGSLPSVLKTSTALTLLEIYFHIPQLSTRRFVLVLLARITGNMDITHPVGNLSEAEYLLTQYADLPNNDMRDKVLAIVRQVCIANGGDVGVQYEG